MNPVLEFETLKSEVSQSLYISQVYSVNRSSVFIFLSLVKTVVKFI